MDALEAVNEAAKKRSTIIINFYRGAWCPMCKSWANKFVSVHDFESRVNAIDATVFFICSEAADLAARNQSAFGMTGKPNVVFVNDPENKVATEVNKHFNDVNVVIDHTKAGMKNHFENYVNGYTQGATVAFSVTDSQWSSNALHTWATKPSILNMSGAFGRPKPSAVFESIEAAVTESRTKK